MKQEERALHTAANRRSFLKGAGMTGLGLAGAAMLGSRLTTGEQKVEAAAYSDTDILNFALNLEYLEAEFYAMSTYGSTLVKLGVISSSDETGPTTGGSLVHGFSAEATLAEWLRTDEFNHVRYLRSVLGTRAVKKPAINLNAKGYGFASVASWLKLARQFEDVGRSAYLGAAPLISNNSYLAAAGAILATEGQHVGALRLTCVMKGVVSPAVDSLDIPPSAKALFSVNKNGLSIPRTPPQVLNVVYAGGRCAGGFFPNGMNGTIVCRS
jgi:hypothetical protein